MKKCLLLCLNNNRIREFIRFCIVGIICTSLDAVFYFERFSRFKYLWQGGTYYFYYKNTF